MDVPGATPFLMQVEDVFWRDRGRVGLVVRGVGVGVVERGQVLVAPGSVRQCTRFAATLVLLSEEDGGAEVRTGARLRFHIGAAAVAGEVTLAGDTEVLRPLHMGGVTVALERPAVLENGLPFAFRYLGRAAGTGVVTLRR
ncbi:EF-Tu C-terminal domain-related protein [Streptomyces liangshanensis]|uniref:EF-Tu C-terminal domain-related protein n=1 Tax=Streptomyces liangshanensis TaxID=2717324 RepID=UPI0036D966A6